MMNCTVTHSIPGCRHDDDLPLIIILILILIVLQQQSCAQVQEVMEGRMRYYESSFECLPPGPEPVTLTAKGKATSQI